MCFVYGTMALACPEPSMQAGDCLAGTDLHLQHGRHKFKRTMIALA